MSLATPPIPATIVPRRAIGQFHATVTQEETGTDELEITQHPVQQGAAITDHAYVKPATLSIKFSMDESVAPLRELYQQLLALQASREPFEVVTGKRQYRNMLFKTLGQTTDNVSENVLAITAQLQEVFIASVEVTEVPDRYKQRNAGKTGKTENAGTKKAQIVDVTKKSILSTLGIR